MALNWVGEQVRYDGYDNELDEWLLFDAVREPTELIETLKEIPKAGSRVSEPHAANATTEHASGFYFLQRRPMARC